MHHPSAAAPPTTPQIVSLILSVALTVAGATAIAHGERGFLWEALLLAVMIGGSTAGGMVMSAKNPRKEAIAKADTSNSNLEELVATLVSEVRAERNERKRLEAIMTATSRDVVTMGAHVKDMVGFDRNILDGVRSLSARYDEGAMSDSGQHRIYRVERRSQREPSGGYPLPR